jgi:hypothetical protein
LAASDRFHCRFIDQETDETPLLGKVVWCPFLDGKCGSRTLQSRADLPTGAGSIASYFGG